MTPNVRAGQSAISIWRFAAFVAAAFLFFWLVVRPQLLFQYQQPAFFVTARYFETFLAYPGGLAEYLSHIISQFFRIPALGAAWLVLLIAAITLLLQFLWKRLNAGNPAPVLAFVGGGLLVALQSGYSVNISYTITILMALLGAAIYLRLYHRSPLIRLFVYIVLSVVLYYAVAAPFFLFCYYSLLAELFLAKGRVLLRIGLSLVYIAVAVVAPWLAHQYLFLFSAPDIYTYLLPLGLHTRVPGLAVLLYAFLIAAPLGLALRHAVAKDAAATTESKRGTTARRLVVGAVVGVAIIILAFFSVDTKHRVLLTVDRLAELRQWQELVDYAREHPDVLYPSTTLHYNRALYHTGQLCDDLFSYPQVEGEKGLYRTSGPAFDMPYALASLTFEMGHLNAAQTWANEALAIEGESVRVLKLLVLTHLLKEEYAAARLYLNKLSQTLLAKPWSARYRQYLNRPALFKDDPYLSTIYRDEATEGFLIRYGLPYAELKYFIETHPGNRMAMHYYAAFCLLSRRLDRLIEFLPSYLKLISQDIPQNVEEALVFAMSQGVAPELETSRLRIRRYTINRFQEFMSVIAEHDNNVAQAQADLLESFGDTYWSYNLYHQSQELNP